jgi:CrcB protein
MVSCHEKNTWHPVHRAGKTSLAPGGGGGIFTKELVGPGKKYLSPCLDGAGAGIFYGAMKMDMIAAAFAGSGAGGVLRYLTGLLVSHLWPSHAFPWATLLVNVAGSALIGGLFAFTASGWGAPGWVRVGLIAGLCGGFTTFSSFSLQTYELLEEARLAAAMMNVVSNVFLCLLGVWGGIALVRIVIPSGTGG